MYKNCQKYFIKLIKPIKLLSTLFYAKKNKIKKVYSYKAIVTQNQSLKRKSYSHYGFTLVELIMVMGIVGVLAGFVLISLPGTQRTSRDTKRKSDLRNIATALRLYYNSRGNYPCNDPQNRIRGCGTQSNCANVTKCDWGKEWSVGSTTYMSVLPEEKKVGRPQYRYTYQNDDDFTLEVCLENRQDPDCRIGASPPWCTGALGCVFEIKP